MPQRIPGPCPLPPGHPTGEPRHYSAGCRCEDSRQANNAYTARLRREIAYGRREPDRVLPAAPTAALLRGLISGGIQVKRIATATGITESILYRLLNGEQDTLRRSTAERIAAYTPAPGDDLTHNTVTALGAARRLQALAAVGWSAREVATRSETLCERPVSDTVTKAVRCGRAQRIYLYVHQTIAVVYDELWDQAPPAGSKQQRAAITRSLRAAERGGWLPPMVWDDWGLDDPNYRPDPAYVRVPGEQARMESLVELLDDGTDLAAAARRAGYSQPDSAKRALHRAGYSLRSWPHLVPLPAVLSHAA